MTSSVRPEHQQSSILASTLHLRSFDFHVLRNCDINASTIYIKTLFRDFIKLYWRTNQCELQNDTGNCFSPNPAEEKQFFQRLLQDEKLDDGTFAEEPDQYLLSRDLKNQVRIYTACSSGRYKRLDIYSRNWYKGTN